jgi:hypothetical protein
MRAAVIDPARFFSNGGLGDDFSSASAAAKVCRIDNKNIMIDGLLRRQGGRPSGRGDVLMWRHSRLIQAASIIKGARP